jgi:hypothetical protein
MKPKLFRDPHLPKKEAWKPPPVKWRCACGTGNWAHENICAGCGEKKPRE